MEIKLLIGLGNPGDEYQNTFHNVGHLFIDYLKTDPKLRMHANLRKPDVYMNESGKYVKAALKKYKLRPREILIVHDDADIPLGSFKMSFGRGSAGHQGIESIIKTLKTKSFYRLRIGVRPSPRAGLPAETRRSSPSPPVGGFGRVKAGELVQKKIGAKERKVLENLFLDLRIRYF